MPSQTKPSENLRFLDFATFLRKFEQRTFGIMWLLGAGASRACGIKTAEDMIWDFKARLYRSHQNIPASVVGDLSDQRVRDILQQFFDARSGYPTLGKEDEYSGYFEKTYPEEKDRRRYIAHLVEKATPGFGHKALAHLMKLDLCRIVWTTNFDQVLEDAVGNVFGTRSTITVGDLNEPEKVRNAYAEQNWPICAKLHGDFHSCLLKNTPKELAEQNKKMRNVFLDACRNWGLIVTGYSGRDASVLKVLDEAIRDGAGFPNGLFWFIRERDKPYDSVVNLIKEAKVQGIDADFVVVESFDELLSDIVRYLPQTEDLIVELDEQRKIAPRKIDLSDRKATAPFVRTNALPIIEYPRTCRLIECNIGGTEEVREVLEESNSNLLASRIKKGVLIFGDNGDIKRAFKDHEISRMDAHGILPSRLTFESGERSLLRAALFRALENYCGLVIENHKHRNFIRADQTTDAMVFDFEKLTKEVQQCHGIVQETDIIWTEACGLRLDYRMGNLWLLIEPFVHIDVPEDVADESLMMAREFVRERRAKRYNRQAHNILEGWIFALFGGSKDIVDIGVDGGTGIGAQFAVCPITAFSGIQL